MGSGGSSTSSTGAPNSNANASLSCLRPSQQQQPLFFPNSSVRPPPSPAVVAAAVPRPAGPSSERAAHHAVAQPSPPTPMRLGSGPADHRQAPSTTMASAPPPPSAAVAPSHPDGPAATLTPLAALIPTGEHFVPRRQPALPSASHSPQTFAPSLEDFKPVEPELCKHLECAVCLEPWIDPVELSPCRHIFCRRCAEPIGKCPECREPIQRKDPANRKFASMAEAVLLACSKCSWRGTRKEAAGHRCLEEGTSRSHLSPGAAIEQHNPIPVALPSPQPVNDVWSIAALTDTSHDADYALFLHCSGDANDGFSMNELSRYLLRQSYASPTDEDWRRLGPAPTFDTFCAWIKEIRERTRRYGGNISAAVAPATAAARPAIGVSLLPVGRTLPPRSPPLPSSTLAAAPVVVTPPSVVAVPSLLLESSPLSAVHRPPPGVTVPVDAVHASFSLLRAASESSWQAVGWWLSMGAMPDKTAGENGWTALHYAAAADEKTSATAEGTPTASAALKLLLNRGASPVKSGHDGRQPLHRAADTGTLEAVRTLLSQPAVLVNIDAPDLEGNTALHLAAANGRADIVTALCAAGADVNVAAPGKRSVVHLAVAAWSAAHRTDGPSSTTSVAAGSGNSQGDGNELSCLNALFSFPAVKATLADAAGETPLHAAVSLCAGLRAAAGSQRDDCDDDTKRLLRLLVDVGKAQVDAQDANGRTALHLASALGLAGVVRELVALGGNPLVVTDATHGRQTALHSAVIAGHVSVVEALLRSIPDTQTQAAIIEVTDRRGWGPLHWAAYQGHDAVIRALVKEAARILSVCDNQASADKRDTSHLLQAFISCPAEGDGDVTPLHLAAEQGRSAAAVALLQAGADKAAVDDDRRTALHRAVAKQMGTAVGETKGGSSTKDVVAVLVANGLDPCAPDNDGMTPVHDAARQGLVSELKLMLNPSAPCTSRAVAATDHDGRTPLHHAALSGNVKTVELLLSVHANPRAEDNRNETPLQLARSLVHYDIVSLLSFASV